MIVNRDVLDNFLMFNPITGDDPENFKQRIGKETPKEDNPCKVVPCLCWPISCARQGEDPENFKQRNGKETPK